MKKLKNKSKLEKKFTNGCGPEGFTIKHSTADHFRSACNTHDLDYLSLKDGDEKSRESADINFLRNMIVIASQQTSSVKRVYLKAAAYIYYYSVRAFGRFFVGDKK